MHKVEYKLLKEYALEQRLELFLPQLVKLEHESYEATEAASEKSLQLRATKCADWFVVMVGPESTHVLGFACGTLGRTSSIASGDAMTSHLEDGNTLFLHSVVVKASLRGQGYGLKLVEEFIQAARDTEQVESIALIAKAKGVALYNRAGFSFMGDSPLRHGSERWFAMELRLKSHPVVCIDAFGDRPWSGNSATVVVLNDAPFGSVKHHVSKRAKVECDPASEDVYLGNVAREFNVAETAFVRFDTLEGTGFGSTLSPLQAVVARAETSVIKSTVFNETLATLKKSFKIRADVKFRVGDAASEQGQNVGSLVALSFAKAVGLNHAATARLWCEHLWNVLEHPEESSHPNIRSFLKGGEVVFYQTNNGSEINTPLESVDLDGLALLCARNSPLVNQELTNCALKIIKENVTFVDCNHQNERLIEMFKSFFQVDLDHLTAAHKFQHVARLSLPLLAIITRDNIVDLPRSVVDASLGVKTLGAFCDEYKLDDQARRRLHAPSAQQSSGSVASCTLRWFTPSRVEVDLCGHATLAAAHALFVHLGPFARRSEMSAIHFSTRSGTLVAKRVPDGSGIELDFPLQTVTVSKDKDELLSALPILKAFPNLTKDDITAVGTTSTNDCLVVVTKKAFHSKLNKIDLAQIKMCEGRGVCVSCPEAEGPIDFSSRFFAPQVGIDEDPVTGSTHCFLAPYWGEILNKSVLVGRQHSERGGQIECVVNRESNRVLLKGKGMMTWKGEVMLG